MTTEIKKLPKCQVEIMCEMPWEEFDAYRVKAIANFSQKVKVPGFRPGKAPQGVIENDIGKDEILAEASKMVLQEKFADIISKEKLEPIGPPQADVLKLAQGNPFCFKIRIEVLPEIVLPGYKKIAKETKQEQPEATDKEIKETLNWVLRTRADFKELNTQAKERDFVEIEYQSQDLDNNKLFKDGFLLGKGGLVKGFEENLIGMKEGEEKECEVVFPDNFAKKDLAGKKSHFKIKMEKVKEMILPVLNDGLAKTLGKFETVNDLKKSIQEGIQRDKKEYALLQWRERVISKVAEASNFEVPEYLVSIEAKRIASEAPDIPKAQKKVKEFLCLQQIGKENKVEVFLTEIEQAVNNYLTNYPQEKVKEIDIDRLKEYYKEMLFNEKVFKLLEGFSNASSKNVW